MTNTIGRYSVPNGYGTDCQLPCPAMLRTKEDPHVKAANEAWSSGSLTHVVAYTVSMNKLSEAGDVLEAMVRVGWVHTTTALALHGTSAFVLMTFVRPKES